MGHAKAQVGSGRRAARSMCRAVEAWRSSGAAPGWAHDYLVTRNDKSEVFPGFEHPDTEFIYLLEGSQASCRMDPRSC